jgi:hypothetical protein
MGEKCGVRGEEEGFYLYDSEGGIIFFWPKTQQLIIMFIFAEI